MNYRFQPVDEEGFFVNDGVRMVDPTFAQEVFENLEIQENGVPVSKVGGTAIIIEPFNSLIVAQSLSKLPTQDFEITNSYGHKFVADPDDISVDEWDRFHGRTTKGLPFVLSRKAQMQFFDELDEFGDDFFVLGGTKFQPKPWLGQGEAAQHSQFWNDRYTQNETHFDLGKPSPIFESLAPKFKFTKSRILVAGSGPGHDAAFFSELNHFVTAVDFSDAALSRAKQNYSSRTIQWTKADLLKPPPQMHDKFDLIVEHTLYCAIDPVQRSNLIKSYYRLLADQGQLLAIFYVFEPRADGPPFGGSEWEVRERLKKQFDVHFWQRSQVSIERRLGHELVVLAKKKSLS